VIAVFSGKTHFGDGKLIFIFFATGNNLVLLLRSNLIKIDLMLIRKWLTFKAALYIGYQTPSNSESSCRLLKSLCVLLFVVKLYG